MHQSVSQNLTEQVGERAPIIEAIDIHKEYDTGTISAQALKGVRLHIQRGDIWTTATRLTITKLVMSLPSETSPLGGP
jgi:hypothetical protein